MGDHLCEQHERVPPLDLDSDHDELGKDQRGEGDAHHVDEPLLE